MPTILFAPETRYISETTRMVDVARACPDSIRPVFLSYGGPYEHFVTDAGFPVHRLEPSMTEALSEHMFQIEHLEKFGDLVPEQELVIRVANEIDLIREIKPAAVVTGFVHSTAISSQVTRVPLVWITPGVMILPYFKAGLGHWPDVFDYRVLRRVPERILKGIIKQGARLSIMLFSSVNRLCRRYGLKPYKSFPHMLETGYTLMSDVPEMTGLVNLPSHFQYVGPFVTRLDIPVPPEVERIPADRPLVYFAMGSSGHSHIVKKILEGFGGRPYHVVAPVRHLVESTRAAYAGPSAPGPAEAAVGAPSGITRKLEFNPGVIEEMVRDMTPVRVPDNVTVTGWLPAHKVNPMADVSVIHGGQGSVYQAMLAGTPVVGVGMQPEQEANLECLVRKGIAIRIKKRRVTAEAVLAAVDVMLDDKKAREAARAFGKIVEGWDGPTRSAEFLVRTFPD